MKLFFTTAFLLFWFTVRAQSTGWYIIQPGASFKVISLSGGDIQQKLPPMSVQMGVSECVLVAMAQGNDFFVFDPSGRVLSFEKQYLLKAPEKVGSGVGHLLEDLQLLNGHTLIKGSFVWVEGQNTANETLAIRVASNQLLNIPQRKVELLLNNWRKSVYSVNYAK